MDDPAKHQRAQLRTFVTILRGTPAGKPAEIERLRRSLTGLANAFASGIDVPTGGHALMAEVWREEVARVGEAIAAFTAHWHALGRIEESTIMFNAARDQFAASVLRLLDRLDAGFAGICAQTPVHVPPPTGIASLDQDHQQVFALLGGLRAVQGDGLVCVTGDFIARLTAYAERHFEDEERLMTETEFPGSEDHRAEHQRARTLILEFRNDHDDGRCVPPSMLLAFLEHWLTTHIAHTDQALARHVQSLSRA